MNLSALALSSKQLRSIAESERHRLSIWSGAVRSGKTIASLVAFIIALACAPSSGLIVIVGRSLQTIERNIIEPLQDPALFGPLAKKIHHTRGATTAVVLGRTVHLIGASDARAEGRIRGATICLAMADEITLLPEGFFNQLLARLSVAGARLIGTTNPDSPAHWLRRNFLLRQGELNLGSWQFTLDDNPALPEAYVEALKAEYVGLWYRRFILGEWCAAEGAIFDMFDDQVHVVDILPPIRQWLCAAIDYGTTNPLHAVLLGLGADSTLYAVSEWRYDSKQQRRQMTDSEYTERLRAWLQEVPIPASRRADGSWMRGVQPHYLIVDPSAASLRTQLHREGLNPVAGNNAVLDGIRTVSSLFASNRLKIARDCPQLIAELPGYSWDDTAAGKGEDKPIKVADHGVDALRYAVMTTRSMWQHEIRLATAA